MRSTPSPSRTISHLARTTSTQPAASGRRRRPAAGSSWCRSRSRRPGSPAASLGVGDAGPAGPPRRRAAPSASSPKRVDPGPGREAWPTSTCRHFTRFGMPPALMPVDLGDVPERVAAGQVVLVGRGGRRAASSGSAAQPVGHLPHQPGRLEAADRGRPPAGRSGSTASGTACRRGSRGDGLDDVRVPARAAVRRRRRIARGARPSCAATTAAVRRRRAPAPVTSRSRRPSARCPRAAGSTTGRRGHGRAGARRRRVGAGCGSCRPGRRPCRRCRPGIDVLQPRAGLLPRCTPGRCQLPCPAAAARRRCCWSRSLCAAGC